jgi:hypothetical protein
LHIRVRSVLVCMLRNGVVIQPLLALVGARREMCDVAARTPDHGHLLFGLVSACGSGHTLEHLPKAILEVWRFHPFGGTEIEAQGFPHDLCHRQSVLPTIRLQLLPQARRESDHQWGCGHQKVREAPLRVPRSCVRLPPSVYGVGAIRAIYSCVSCPLFMRLLWRVLPLDKLL